MFFGFLCSWRSLYYWFFPRGGLSRRCGWNAAPRRDEYNIFCRGMCFFLWNFWRDAQCVLLQRLEAGLFLCLLCKGHLNGIQVKCDQLFPRTRLGFICHCLSFSLASSSRTKRTHRRTLILFFGTVIKTRLEADYFLLNVAQCREVAPPYWMVLEVLVYGCGTGVIISC